MINQKDNRKIRIVYLVLFSNSNLTFLIISFFRTFFFSSRYSPFQVVLAGVLLLISQHYLLRHYVECTALPWNKAAKIEIINKVRQFETERRKRSKTEEEVEKLKPTIVCDNWNEYFSAISFFSFKVALKRGQLNESFFVCQENYLTSIQIPNSFRG